MRVKVNVKSVPISRLFGLLWRSVTRKPSRNMKPWFLRSFCVCKDAGPLNNHRDQIFKFLEIKECLKGPNNCEQAGNPE